MRPSPVTLVRAFENELGDGADTDGPIAFEIAPLERAIEGLDVEIRDAMELASAYSSTRALRGDHRPRLHRDRTRRFGRRQLYRFVRG